MGTAKKLLMVSACALVDADLRVLIAQRPEGKSLAGLWEFPGGKREPGETPEVALARELHEELGITVEVGAPLIAVPQAYPTKRLRLDVRAIEGWHGAARGREGQALAWVPPARLETYAMPPGDRPVVAALQQAAAYLVTPDPGEDDGAWLAGLERALELGVRRVQLRNTRADSIRWPPLVAAAAERCRTAGAEVLVNGDANLARDYGCGLHLRAAQLRTLAGRPVGDGIALAASCHDAAELRRAEDLGCRFAVLGAVAPTPSHPGESGMGWDGFARLREEVSLPIYAIGGLAPDDLPTARAHGAQGIAAIRGFWPAPL